MTAVQISYQVGHYPSAKQACEVLWDHFLAPPPPPEGITFITEAKRDFKLTLLKSVHKHTLTFSVLPNNNNNSEHL